MTSGYKICFYIFILAIFVKSSSTSYIYSRNSTHKVINYSTLEKETNETSENQALIKDDTACEDKTAIENDEENDFNEMDTKLINDETAILPMNKLGKYFIEDEVIKILENNLEVVIILSNINTGNPLTEPEKTKLITSFIIPVYAMYFNYNTPEIIEILTILEPTLYKTNLTSNINANIIIQEIDIIFKKNPHILQILEKIQLNEMLSTEDRKEIIVGFIIPLCEAIIPNRPSDLHLTLNELIKNKLLEMSAAKETLLDELVKILVPNVSIRTRNALTAADKRKLIDDHVLSTVNTHDHIGLETSAVTRNTRITDIETEELIIILKENPVLTNILKKINLDEALNADEKRILLERLIVPLNIIDTESKIVNVLTPLRPEILTVNHRNGRLSSATVDIVDIDVKIEEIRIILKKNPNLLRILTKIQLNEALTAEERKELAVDLVEPLCQGNSPSRPSDLHLTLNELIKNKLLERNAAKETLLDELVKILVPNVSIRNRNALTAVDKRKLIDDHVLSTVNTHDHMGLETSAVTRNTRITDFETEELIIILKENPILINILKKINLDEALSANEKRILLKRLIVPLNIIDTESKIVNVLTPLRPEILTVNHRNGRLSSATVDIVDIDVKIEEIRIILKKNPNLLRILTKIQLNEELTAEERKELAVDVVEPLCQGNGPSRPSDLHLTLNELIKNKLLERSAAKETLLDELVKILVPNVSIRNRNAQTAVDKRKLIDDHVLSTVNTHDHMGLETSAVTRNTRITDFETEELIIILKENPILINILKKINLDEALSANEKRILLERLIVPLNIIDTESKIVNVLTPLRPEILTVNHRNGRLSSATVDIVDIDVKIEEIRIILKKNPNLLRILTKIQLNEALTAEERKELAVDLVEPLCQGNSPSRPSDLHLTLNELIKNKLLERNAAKETLLDELVKILVPNVSIRNRNALTAVDKRKLIDDHVLSTVNTHDHMGLETSAVTRNTRITDFETEELIIILKENPILINILKKINLDEALSANEKRILLERLIVPLNIIDTESKIVNVLTPLRPEILTVNHRNGRLSSATVDIVDIDVKIEEIRIILKKNPNLLRILTKIQLNEALTAEERKELAVDLVEPLCQGNSPSRPSDLHLTLNELIKNKLLERNAAKKTLLDELVKILVPNVSIRNRNALTAVDKRKLIDDHVLSTVNTHDHIGLETSAVTRNTRITDFETEELIIILKENPILINILKKINLDEALSANEKRILLERLIVPLNIIDTESKIVNVLTPLRPEILTVNHRNGRLSSATVDIVDIDVKIEEIRIILKKNPNLLRILTKIQLNEALTAEERKELAVDLVEPLCQGNSPSRPSDLHLTLNELIKNKLLERNAAKETLLDELVKILVPNVSIRNRNALTAVDKRKLIDDHVLSTVNTHDHMGLETSAVTRNTRITDFETEELIIILKENPILINILKKINLDEALSANEKRILLERLIVPLNIIDTESKIVNVLTPLRPEILTVNHRNGRLSSATVDIVDIDVKIEEIRIILKKNPNLLRILTKIQLNEALTAEERKELAVDLVETLCQGNSPSRPSNLHLTLNELIKNKLLERSAAKETLLDELVKILVPNVSIRNRNALTAVDKRKLIDDHVLSTVNTHDHMGLETSAVTRNTRITDFETEELIIILKENPILINILKKINLDEALSANEKRILLERLIVPLNIIDTESKIVNVLTPLRPEILTVNHRNGRLSSATVDIVDIDVKIEEIRIILKKNPNLLRILTKIQLNEALTAEERKELAVDLVEPLCQGNSPSRPSDLHLTLNELIKNKLLERSAAKETLLDELVKILVPNVSIRNRNALTAVDKRKLIDDHVLSTVNTHDHMGLETSAVTRNTRITDFETEELIIILKENPILINILKKINLDEALSANEKRILLERLIVPLNIIDTESKIVNVLTPLRPEILTVNHRNGRLSSATVDIVDIDVKIEEIRIILKKNPNLLRILTKIQLNEALTAEERKELAVDLVEPLCQGNSPSRPSDLHLTLNELIKNKLLERNAAKETLLDELVKILVPNVSIRNRNALTAVDKRKLIDDHVLSTVNTHDHMGLETSAVTRNTRITDFETEELIIILKENPILINILKKINLDEALSANEKRILLERLIVPLNIIDTESKIVNVLTPLRPEILTVNHRNGRLSSATVDIVDIDVKIEEIRIILKKNPNLLRILTKIQLNEALRAEERKELAVDLVEPLCQGNSPSRPSDLHLTLNELIKNKLLERNAAKETLLDELVKILVPNVSIRNRNALTAVDKRKLIDDHVLSTVNTHDHIGLETSAVTRNTRITDIETEELIIILKENPILINILKKINLDEALSANEKRILLERLIVPLNIIDTESKIVNVLTPLRPEILTVNHRNGRLSSATVDIVDIDVKIEEIRIILKKNPNLLRILTKIQLNEALTAEERKELAVDLVEPLCQGNSPSRPSDLHLTLNELIKNKLLERNAAKETLLDELVKILVPNVSIRNRNALTAVDKRKLIDDHVLSTVNTHDHIGLETSAVTRNTRITDFETEELIIILKENPILINILKKINLDEALSANEKRILLERLIVPLNIIDTESKIVNVLTPLRPEILTVNHRNGRLSSATVDIVDIDVKIEEIRIILKKNPNLLRILTKIQLNEALTAEERKELAVDLVEPLCQGNSPSRPSDLHLTLNELIKNKLLERNAAKETLLDELVKILVPNVSIRNRNALTAVDKRKLIDDHVLSTVNTHDHMGLETSAVTRNTRITDFETEELIIILKENPILINILKKINLDEALSANEKRILLERLIVPLNIIDTESKIVNVLTPLRPEILTVNHRNGRLSSATVDIVDIDVKIEEIRIILKKNPNLLRILTKIQLNEAITAEERKELAVDLVEPLCQGNSPSRPSDLHLTLNELIKNKLLERNAAKETLLDELVKILVPNVSIRNRNALTAVDKRKLIDDHVLSTVNTHDHIGLETSAVTRNTRITDIETEELIIILKENPILINILKKINLDEALSANEKRILLERLIVPLNIIDTESKIVNVLTPLRPEILTVNHRNGRLSSATVDIVDIDVKIEEIRIILKKNPNLLRILTKIQLNEALTAEERKELAVDLVEPLCQGNSPSRPSDLHLTLNELIKNKLLERNAAKETLLDELVKILVPNVSIRNRNALTAVDKRKLIDDHVLSTVNTHDHMGLETSAVTRNTRITDFETEELIIILKENPILINILKKINLDEALSANEKRILLERLIVPLNIIDTESKIVNVLTPLRPEILTVNHRNGRLSSATVDIVDIDVKIEEIRIILKKNPNLLRILTKIQLNEALTAEERKELAVDLVEPLCQGNSPSRPSDLHLTLNELIKNKLLERNAAKETLLDELVKILVPNVSIRNRNALTAVDKRKLIDDHVLSTVNTHDHMGLETSAVTRNTRITDFETEELIIILKENPILINILKKINLDEALSANEKRILLERLIVPLNIIDTESKIVNVLTPLRPEILTVNHRNGRLSSATVDIVDIDVKIEEIRIILKKNPNLLRILTKIQLNEALTAEERKELAVDLVEPLCQGNSPSRPSDLHLTLNELIKNKLLERSAAKETLLDELVKILVPNVSIRNRNALTAVDKRKLIDDHVLSTVNTHDHMGLETSAVTRNTRITDFETEELIIILKENPILINILKKINLDEALSANEKRILLERLIVPLNIIDTESKIVNVLTPLRPEILTVNHRNGRLSSATVDIVDIDVKIEEIRIILKKNPNLLRILTKIQLNEALTAEERKELAVDLVEPLCQGNSPSRPSDLHLTLNELIKNKLLERNAAKETLLDELVKILVPNVSIRNRNALTAVDKRKLIDDHVLSTVNTHDHMGLETSAVTRNTRITDFETEELIIILKENPILINILKKINLDEALSANEKRILLERLIVPLNIIDTESKIVNVLTPLRPEILTVNHRNGRLSSATVDIVDIDVKIEEIRIILKKNPNLLRILTKIQLNEALTAEERKELAVDLVEPLCQGNSPNRPSDLHLTLNELIKNKLLERSAAKETLLDELVKILVPNVSIRNRNALTAVDKRKLIDDHVLSTVNTHDHMGLETSAVTRNTRITDFETEELIIILKENPILINILKKINLDEALSANEKRILLERLIVPLNIIDTESKIVNVLTPLRPEILTVNHRNGRLSSATVDIVDIDVKIEEIRIILKKNPNLLRILTKIQLNEALTAEERKELAVDLVEPLCQGNSPSRPSDLHLTLNELIKNKLLERNAAKETLLDELVKILVPNVSIRNRNALTAVDKRKLIDDHVLSTVNTHDHMGLETSAVTRNTRITDFETEELIIILKENPILINILKKINLDEALSANEKRILLERLIVPLNIIDTESKIVNVLTPLRPEILTVNHRNGRLSSATVDIVDIDVKIEEIRIILKKNPNLLRILTKIQLNEALTAEERKELAVDLVEPLCRSTVKPLALPEVISNLDLSHKNAFEVSQDMILRTDNLLIILKRNPLLIKVLKKIYLDEPLEPTEVTMLINKLLKPLMNYNSLHDNSNMSNILLILSHQTFDYNNLSAFSVDDALKGVKVALKSNPNLIEILTKISLNEPLSSLQKNEFCSEFVVPISLRLSSNIARSKTNLASNINVISTSLSEYKSLSSIENLSPDIISDNTLSVKDKLRSYLKDDIISSQSSSSLLKELKKCSQLPDRINIFKNIVMDSSILLSDIEDIEKREELLRLELNWLSLKDVLDKVLLENLPHNMDAIESERVFFLIEYLTRLSLRINEIKESISKESVLKCFEHPRNQSRINFNTFLSPREKKIIDYAVKDESEKAIYISLYSKIPPELKPTILKYLSLETTEQIIYLENIFLDIRNSCPQPLARIDKQNQHEEGLKLIQEFFSTNPQLIDALYSENLRTLPELLSIHFLSDALSMTEPISNGLSHKNLYLLSGIIDGILQISAAFLHQSLRVLLSSILLKIFVILGELIVTLKLRISQNSLESLETSKLLLINITSLLSIVLLNVGYVFKLLLRSSLGDTLYYLFNYLSNYVRDNELIVNNVNDSFVNRVKHDSCRNLCMG